MGNHHSAEERGLGPREAMGATLAFHQHAKPRSQALREMKELTLSNHQPGLESPGLGDRPFLAGAGVRPVPPTGGRVAPLVKRHDSNVVAPSALAVGAEGENFRRKGALPRLASDEALLEIRGQGAESNVLPRYDRERGPLPPARTREERDRIATPPHRTRNRSSESARSRESARSSSNRGGPSSPRLEPIPGEDFVLNADQVASLLRFPPGSGAARLVTAMFDQDADGLINFTEYIVLLAFLTRGDKDLNIATEEKVNLVFDAFDTDKSHRLERDEIVELFDHIAHAAHGLTGIDWPTAERSAAVDSLFEGTGSGGTNKKQFLKWARGDANFKFFLRRLADLGGGSGELTLAKFPAVAGDKRMRILCLDGGGMRGIMQAKIIARLEARHPGFLDSVDFFAGTSVGSLLAASYCCGYHPEKVVADFLKESPKMFEPYAGTIVAEIKRVVTSGNSMTNFSHFAQEAFGDIKMDNLVKKLLIPTFSLKDTHPLHGKSSWKPKFFHNFHDADTGACDDSLVRDVVLRSMATPTYFPSYQGYIDGGVAANSPTMCAVAQAVSKRYGRKRLADLVILSVGTGDHMNSIDTHDGKDEVDWGMAQWVRPLLGILTESSENTADFQARALLGECYHRVSPFLATTSKIDDPRSLPKYHQLGAEMDLAQTEEWLKEQWF